MEDKFKKCFSIKEINTDFDFLEKEYGFSSMMNETNYTLSLLYKNFTTGVKISFEPYDVGIIIFIIRLIDNKIIETSKPLKSDTIINIFDFGDLLAIRDNSLLNEIKKVNHPGSLTPIEFKKMISMYANALKRYGDDILSGDFTIFNELDKIVKERARIYNQLK